MTVASDARTLVPASAIRTQRVAWLQRGWIPVGGISLLAGVPGVGKSLWTVQLAARLSRGELTGSPERTLILTAEDSLSATVAPRLREAGADMDKVFVPSDGDRSLWLPDAVPEIREWVEANEVRLLIIDPLTAFLPDGKVDTWRDSSVRSALAPLARVADRAKIAVVAVVHLNKGAGGDPMRRIGGSIGLPAAARSVLLLADNPDDPGAERRILAHAKSNYGRLSHSLLLELRENVQLETAQLVEIGTSTQTAGDLLSEQEMPSRLDEAIDFLKVELANGGRPAGEVRKTAEKAGIKEITLQRARRCLGVKSEKVGFDHWAWTLPDETASAQDTDGKPAA